MRPLFLHVRFLLNQDWVRALSIQRGKKSAAARDCHRRGWQNKQKSSQDGNTTGTGGKDGRMEIKLVKIAEIKPYDRNPRNNDGAVDAVAASIQEFGWQQPIVVDHDGVIIAGHTRYKAAQKLKCKEVPVVVAENLTDEQVRAYRLADNKTGELAGWDFSALEEELAGLAEIDMQQFGFAGSEAEDFNIDNLFAEAAPKEKEAKEIKCPHCGMYFTP